MEIEKKPNKIPDISAVTSFFKSLTLNANNGWKEDETEMKMLDMTEDSCFLSPCPSRVTKTTTQGTMTSMTSLLLEDSCPTAPYPSGTLKRPHGSGPPNTETDTLPCKQLFYFKNFALIYK